MTETQKGVRILNELIELNNDRIAGFEKAIADIKEENIDLKAIFQRYTSQSRKFGQELTAIVSSNAEEPETGTSVAGTLHRGWIDIKSLFTGGTRKSILEEAERGEDAIKRAYNDALESGLLSPEIYDLVKNQATDINSAHDEIKVLRDL